MWEFHVTKNNSLGNAVGTKCVISLQTTFDPPGLGVAIKSDGRVLNVTVTTCDDVVCEKWSKLKHVVLPNRTIEQGEESIRACLVWLNKHTTQT